MKDVKPYVTGVAFLRSPIQLMQNKNIVIYNFTALIDNLFTDFNSDCYSWKHW